MKAWGQKWLIYIFTGICVFGGISRSMYIFL